MADSSTTAQPYRGFILLLSLVVVTVSLYWAQKVLIPLALAMLLAFILSPLVTALQHRGLGRIPAVILVVILAFAFLGAFGAGLVVQVRSLVEELPQHKDEIRTKLETLPGMSGESFPAKVNHAVQEVTGSLLHTDGNEAGKGTPDSPVVVRVEVSRYEQLQSALGPITEALATTGLVIVLVIFMLVLREDLRNRIVRLIGHGRLIHTTRALDDAAHRISRYLIVQVVINAGFGLVLYLGLMLIGVPYALLWGFLGAALRFVPYIGTWLASAMLLIFCVGFLPGWDKTMLVAVLWFALEMITSQLLEPLLIGHSTGVSALALLVAAAFWTWLWGPVGLVLSTPLTVCLVVLGKYVPPLEFLTILLGDEPVLKTEVSFYQRLLARDQDEATDLVEEYLQTHELAEVYDELLLPTLILAERDRERGELTEEDEAFIFQTTREILDDLLFRQQQIHMVAEHGPAALSNEEKPRAVVVGCPAHDEADEVALQMFSQMLDQTLCRVELLRAGQLAVDLLEQIEKLSPAAVCIAALPPGGLAQARYLCKRLRARFPDLKLVVGRWGQRENVERTEEKLTTAGADLIATTMAHSIRQITPLLQVAPQQPPPVKRVAGEAVASAR